MLLIKSKEKKCTSPKMKSTLIASKIKMKSFNRSPQFQCNVWCDCFYKKEYKKLTLLDITLHSRYYTCLISILISKKNSYLHMQCSPLSVVAKNL